MTVILKKVGLLLEFWDKAIEYHAYIRDYTNIRLDTNGINKSLTKAFTSTLLDIEMYKI
jgi:hypothetical protein